MTAHDEAYYFAFMNKIRILFSNATKHVKKNNCCFRDACTGKLKTFMG